MSLLGITDHGIQELVSRELATAVGALSDEERALLAGVLDARRRLTSRRFFLRSQLGPFREYLETHPSEAAVFSKVFGPLARRELALIEEYNRDYRNWLRSKTHQSDLQLLGLPMHITQAAPEERRAAAERIRSRVSRYFADPAARKRIEEEKSARGSKDTKRWLQELFTEAALKVSDSLDHPRQIRLGKHWRNGKRRYETPDEVWSEGDDEEFPRWFEQEIKNAAEAILLDKPYPQPLPSSLRKRRRYGSILYKAERALRSKGSSLSSRERELLQHMDAGVRRAELHGVLGVKPVTVRVMFGNIRSKLRSP